MSSWKLTGHAPKRVVQAALLVHEETEDWPDEIVVAGHEIAEDRPDDWVIAAWMPHQPTPSDRAALAALFAGRPPEFKAEKLPEEDWLTLSQQSVAPIRAGRFYVHTPDFAPSGERGTINFAIPASQAFGTGQHETTAGCLAMLDTMKGSGVLVRNLADIGTGTGLLAFAAMALWPRARATASDIDAICAEVVSHNAALNRIPLGARGGELTMVIAPGMDDALLQARGPYDLLIANILANPLIDLAPDFAATVPAGGNLLLAGLLETQESDVRRSYRRAGFRLAARLVNGDWSILWLRRRSGS